MFRLLSKMDLRARLALLAALAIGALTVATFVAWRLIRASESFALRQTEAALYAATLNLARDIQNNPDGLTIPENEAILPPPEPPFPPHPKKPPVPPREAALIAVYTDPLSRLTATTLHPFHRTAGGFVRADGTLIGFAAAIDAGFTHSDELNAQLIANIAALSREAARNNAIASRTIRADDQSLMLFATPILVPPSSSSAADARGDNNSIATAWTMQRSFHLSGDGELINIAALAALGCVLLLVLGFAFLTVRDLRRGVGGIEAGLMRLPADLNYTLDIPSTPELARIARSINALAAALRAGLAQQRNLENDLRRSERLAALGRVVAGVAHEVRNPLAAMKLKLQMTRRAGFAPDKLDATFRVVTEEIDRLDQLVRRLLELGRAPALHPTEFDLSDLVRERLALFTETFERQDVQIDGKHLTSGIIVTADHARLAQVFDNLLQNALAAMPHGGQLKITAATQGSSNAQAAGAASHAFYTRLVISDTGDGIAPSERERIFEPFYSGRDAGTGLGLALAREIVAAHHGKIYVAEDTPHQRGATFIVELPLGAALKNDAENAHA